MVGKKILVVVDMQNDFIDGALGTKEAQAIVPKIVKKINEFDGTEIVVTMDTHHKDYLHTIEGIYLPVEHCMYGTNGHAINDNIANALSASKSILHIIRKRTFGSFDLAEYINEKYIDNGIPIEEITLVGLCTGICVLANAVLLKSVLYGTCEITVDASCCACVTPDTHKTALEAMKLQQIKVINDKENN